MGHAGDGRGTWDADCIARVISTLVDNAIQHGTPTAPITVRSRIDGDDAVLEVRSEGPAILDGELVDMFLPFKPGSNAGAARGSMGLGPGAARPGSMGLDLYIAREVVTAYGVSITVASQAGHGARFTVRLPRSLLAGWRALAARCLETHSMQTSMLNMLKFKYIDVQIAPPLLIQLEIPGDAALSRDFEFSATCGAWIPRFLLGLLSAIDRDHQRRSSLVMVG